MKKNKIISAIMCTILLTGMVDCNVSAKEKVKSDKQNIVVMDSSLGVEGGASILFVSDGENHTHQYIADSALAILKNNKGNSVLNEANARDTIKCFADWPDELGHETDGGTFAGHFYDPDTGKNWLGKTSPTAKGRAISYFNEAVSWYNQGEFEEACICLGKGSHYVSDLNEPHHASNLTAINSNHSEFERYVDQNRTSFKIPNNSFASSVYTTAKKSSLSTILQNGAVYAKSLAPKAQNSKTYYTAGNLCVQHAITNVTQYYYKFAITVGIYK